MSTGPRGKSNHINQDSYDGVAPMSLPPALPKQINPGDAKVGSPSPASGKRGATINPDSFYE